MKSVKTLIMDEMTSMNEKTVFKKENVFFLSRMCVNLFSFEYLKFSSYSVFERSFYTYT